MPISLSQSPRGHNSYQFPHTFVTWPIEITGKCLFLRTGKKTGVLEEPQNRDGNHKKNKPLLPEKKTETDVRLNRQFLTLVETQFGLWKLYKRAT